MGTIVDQAEKKERRRKPTSAGKTMSQATSNQNRQGVALPAGEGWAPNVQAHSGRHLRAVFDEVAREPIPDRLLQLLKDLERSGDK